MSKTKPTSARALQESLEEHESPSTVVGMRRGPSYKVDGKLPTCRDFLDVTVMLPGIDWLDGFAKAGCVRRESPRRCSC